jgi:nucleotide-binding universal stress UspA family protein
MYRNILVPLDGSEFGEQALPLALTVARRTGATLHLIHVHTPQVTAYLEGGGFLGDDLDDRLKAEEEDYLNKTVRRLADVAPGLPVTTRLLDGDVTNELTHHAAAAGMDLVVMTTHGRGAFARFWLGSVADSIIRRLPMPLLLVHPHDGDPDLKAEPNLKHFLLPLDGTPLAEEMVEPVAELAAALKASVTLVRVIEPVPPVPWMPEALPINESVQTMLDRVEELQNKLKAEAASYLAGVARKFQDRSIPVETSVRVERQPAKAILHEVVADGCDLVAIETHGRRGLSRLILGSVADKVIRGSAVPVLVHRPLNP